MCKFSFSAQCWSSAPFLCGISSFVSSATPLRSRFDFTVCIRMQPCKQAKIQFKSSASFIYSNKARPPSPLSVCPIYQSIMAFTKKAKTAGNCVLATQNTPCHRPEESLPPQIIFHWPDVFHFHGGLSDSLIRVVVPWKTSWKLIKAVKQKFAGVI